jgi:predicted outer membrane repeat protein
VNDNSSAGNGGGIYSAFGNVEIDEGDVLGNVALDNGGGIYAYGNITLDDAQLGTLSQPNSAGLDGGGLYTSNGNFYIQEGSVVEGNSAGGDGGGAWGRVHGVVEDSTVRSNIANDDGGGVFMNTDAGFESLWIHTSLFEFNEAGDEGGGVYVSGPPSELLSESVTIIDSTFLQNVASINGGGLAARNIENIAITGTTFAGNRATSGRGGGIDARNGNLYIVNSTFGGVYDCEGEGGDCTLVVPQSAAIGGGGIYVQNELTTINHTTFNDNISYGGPKTGSAIFSDSGSVVYLHNTMVNDTNEISSTIATELLSKGGGGLFKSMGHNLVHDQSFLNVDDFDDDFGDIAFGVQDLGPLANNGGPTPTYLPVAGGQAIDAADDSGPIVDQRGSPRPILLADIGSVEL